MGVLFKDAISKMTLKPETAHQECFQTTLLKWMQDHPNLCRRTTVAQMTRCIQRANLTGQTEKQIRATFYNMLAQSMITHDGKKGSKAQKSYFINYLHFKMPKEVIERAPKEEIEKNEQYGGVELIKKSKEEYDARRKDGAVIDSSTEDVETSLPLTVASDAAEPLKNEEPAVISESTKKEAEALPIPAVPAAPTLDVPIEVDKLPNGNFTLQLNINFTINSKN